MLFKRKRRYKKKSFLDSLGAELVAVLVFVLAVVLLLSLLSRAGQVGEIVSGASLAFVGLSTWALPVLLLSVSINLAREKDYGSLHLSGLFLFVLGSSVLLEYFVYMGGGLLGTFLINAISPYIGYELLAFLSASTIIISLVLVFNTSLSNLFGEESVFFGVLVWIKEFLFGTGDEEENDDDEEEDLQDEEAEDGVEVKEYEMEDEMTEEYDGEKDETKRFLPAGEAGSRSARGGQAARSCNDKVGWKKRNVEINIPVTLLKSKSKKPISGNTEKNQIVIKETLKDFGISVTMSDVTVGPTVTQYAFKPNKGIAVSRIKALTDDLALNLAVHPIRIEAPIPGKPLVGLEVPNQSKVLVSLKEVIKSKAFRERKTNTVIPMGRDVTGKIWMDDLVKMPHILIAGATNSGKSVFLHSLIMSLMFQNSPDDLQFIMIDQKQVELSLYKDIPYLVAPVVTEHKRAIRALQWSVTEMDKRLEMINEANCQNIADYNQKKGRESLPYLVVVVDELGDLMSTAKKKAESAIIRLGQKSRAAGIHLVLATQRPSVDILSGLIKANMPARAAFSVTSSVNSKTILDFTGAEKLMGQGDMLYINSAMSKPIRIQGAFVSKEEIKAVVRYTKKEAGKAKYEQDFEAEGQMIFEYGEEDEGDEMMEEAKKLILSSGKASATMLQSRLGIGYPRANRILDNLEKQGVVGPSIQNKPREVYGGTGS